MMLNITWVPKRQRRHSPASPHPLALYDLSYFWLTPPSPRPRATPVLLPSSILRRKRSTPLSVLFRAAPGLRDSAVAQTALPTWAQFARFAAAFEPPKPGAPAPLRPKGGVGAGGGGGGWSAPVGRAKARHHGISSAPAPVLPDEVRRRCACIEGLGIGSGPGAFFDTDSQRMVVRGRAMSKGCSRPCA